MSHIVIFVITVSSFPRTAGCGRSIVLNMFYESPAHGDFVIRVGVQKVTSLRLAAQPQFG
jgi:hypothetical protein